MKQTALFLFSIFCCFAFFGCLSEKEEQKLKPLPKIEAPKTVVGLYSGLLPEEDSRKHFISFELDSSGNAFLKETFVRDSMEVFLDTLSYKDSSGILILTFKEANKIWKFKKTSDFQYVFLNPFNEPYMASDSTNYTLIRILKKVGEK